MAHVNLHHPFQPRDQKHKREDDQSEECVAGHLADDITIKNAHNAKVQSNTHAVGLMALCVMAGASTVLRILSPRVSQAALACILLKSSMPTATNLRLDPRFGTRAE